MEGIDRQKYNDQNSPHIRAYISTASSKDNDVLKNNTVY